MSGGGGKAWNGWEPGGGELCKEGGERRGRGTSMIFENKDLKKEIIKY